MAVSNSFRRVFFLLPALAGFLFISPASASDPYPHRIDPSVLENLRQGPNATAYFRRNVPFLFRSDQPVDIVNLGNATARILMLGRYHSPRGTVDLELRGELRDGTLEIAFPMGQLDAALFEWEETGAAPPALKEFSPRIRNVTFRDVGGFRAVYGLKRTLEYQLTIDLDYNQSAKSLMAPRPSFEKAAAFVKSIEKDPRSRLILESNTSGLPIFVSESDEDGSLAAGFLTNTVRQNAKTGRREYAYSEVLQRIARLDEVKRLVKDPSVKAFIEGPEEVRVNAIGSDETGFSFQLSKEGGARLEATLVGKRVSVKP